MNVKLKERLVKIYNYSGVLYECESSTIGSTMLKRLVATEMWLLRRTMRVPLTAGRKYEVRITRSLVTTIRRRQIGYIGRVLRSRSLVKDCLLELIEHTRAIERQRIKFMGGVKAVVGCGKIPESSGSQRTDRDGATLSPTSTFNTR